MLRFRDCGSLFVDILKEHSYFLAIKTRRLKQALTLRLLENSGT